MDALAALRADAVSSGRAGCTLAGERVINVPPVGLWSELALDALQAGDFETWSDEVLDDADFDAWDRVDPSAAECEDFFEEWEGATGETLSSVMSLAAFLRQHAEAVEADLRRWHQVRLRDLYRGRMSYRELWVLISKLPQESWTQTALRDDPKRAELPARDADDGPLEFGPWALVNYQLADLIDAIRDSTWTGVVMATGKDTPQPPKPKRTPRPGAKPEKVRQLSPEQMTYLRNVRGPREE